MSNKKKQGKMKKFIFLWATTLISLLLFGTGFAFGITHSYWYLLVSLFSVICVANIYTKISSHIKKTKIEHKIGLYMVFGFCFLLSLLLFAETEKSVSNPEIKITLLVSSICSFLLSFIFFIKVIGTIKPRKE